jgi:hypothetical protein
MLIFRRIFLSNYWWQKSDIWSQASYRYPISWEAFLDPLDSYFLFADFVDFYTHWTYVLIFLSNCWWQESDIWSQASYRYAILWEAFLDPSDSYFLFADLVGFYTINIKQDELWANALRQTGSRNLTGPKTLPTIWCTYMKLVTKYQISAINSSWEKCDEKCAYMFNVYRNQLSRQTGSRNLKLLLHSIYRQESAFFFMHIYYYVQVNHYTNCVF